MPKTLPPPAMPEIGKPERYYIEGGHEADRRRDPDAHEAFKVGFYVTKGINYTRLWPEKIHAFEHALKHHCNPPSDATPPITEFYAQMAQLVRDRAGEHALQEASRSDDRYAARLARGEECSVVKQEARAFFKLLLPTDHRPSWMNLADFEQLRILKRQWE